jgi:hypothetical protein
VLTDILIHDKPIVNTYVHKKNALPGTDQANLLNLLGYHLKKCAFFVLYRSFWHQKGSLNRAYVQVRGKCFLEQKPNQWPKPM